MLVRGLAEQSMDYTNRLKKNRQEYEAIKGKDTDTIARQEIHKIIQKSVLNGKSKKEIIEELSKREDFKKYDIYFENWTDDQLKKSGVEIDIKGRDEER